MKDKIRQILREGEFDWVSGSEGDEFEKYLHTWLSDWLDARQIGGVEEFIAELPINKQKDFVEELASMLDDVYESGKDEGDEEGYDSGRDSGYEDGYSEGYSEAESEGENKWQDGYDTGFSDGHSEGHSEGYSEAQDECEECD